jgi:sRNA-binding regulator protein Hfq
VKITKNDGTQVKGRISSADENSVTLDNGSVDYSEIKRAIIEIEFNRKER